MVLGPLVSSFGAWMMGCSMSTVFYISIISGIRFYVKQCAAKSTISYRDTPLFSLFSSTPFLITLGAGGTIDAAFCAYQLVAMGADIVECYTDMLTTPYKDCDETERLVAISQAAAADLVATGTIITAYWGLGCPLDVSARAAISVGICAYIAERYTNIVGGFIERLMASLHNNRGVSRVAGA